MRKSSKKILLSHSSLDGELAEMLANVIRRCSLRTISVWHSSDSASDAGLVPGQRWFDEIRKNLQESDSVVLLMTPNSVRSSWVQFEAGFGAGVSNLEIMPIALGIDVFQIPSPLTQWQVYQTNAPEAVMTFLRKLFGRLGVHFDDDLVRGVVFEFAEQCKSFSFGGAQEKATIESQLDSLRAVIESKFQVIDKKVTKIQARNPEWGPITEDGYDLAIHNELSDDFVTVFIDDGSSILDVYNQIYAQISKSVRPWTYLSSWVLRDVDTGQRLIIREVSDEIPAYYIFRRDRALEIVPLSSPYSGEESESVAEIHG